MSFAHMYVCIIVYVVTCPSQKLKYGKQKKNRFLLTLKGRQIANNLFRVPVLTFPTFPRIFSYQFTYMLKHVFVNLFASACDFAHFG